MVIVRNDAIAESKGAVIVVGDTIAFFICRDLATDERERSTIIVDAVDLLNSANGNITDLWTSTIECRELHICIAKDRTIHEYEYAAFVIDNKCVVITRERVRPESIPRDRTVGQSEHAIISDDSIGGTELTVLEGQVRNGDNGTQFYMNSMCSTDREHTCVWTTNDEVLGNEHIATR